MIYYILPPYLLALSICLIPIPGLALPDLRLRDALASVRDLPRGFWPSKRASSPDTTVGINFNPNGSAFLWLPSDTYSGKTFFDDWTFFNEPDFTHGLVNYVNQSTAVEKGYIFVADNGTVFMKADDTTVLPVGQNRDSVRISSKNVYNGGLFILDLNRAPWGCAIWPAFWTVGNDNWPNTGEIDILEGVHDNEHNQITWHTSPGCHLDSNATFTGQIADLNGTANTDCDGNINENSGCAVVEWSQASYGPFFEAQGGGILAMKWDENDISVWSFFRAAIPTDVTKGTPNPSLWGPPSAVLRDTMCDIESNFTNHVIVFDITFCGDWAGNSYATSGCPGTCQERLMDPANFVNATWSINSLQVYKKQPLAAGALQTSGARGAAHARLPVVEVLLLLVGAAVAAAGMAL